MRRPYSRNCLMKNRIIQSVHRHLLPTAPQELRAIMGTWNDRRIRLVCYIDDYITEDMRTALHDAGSQLMDEYLGERRVFIELKQWASGDPLPALNSDTEYHIYSRGLEQISENG